MIMLCPSSRAQFSLSLFLIFVVFFFSSSEVQLQNKSSVHPLLPLLNSSLPATSTDSDDERNSFGNCCLKITRLLALDPENRLLEVFL